MAGISNRGVSSKKLSSRRVTTAQQQVVDVPDAPTSVTATDVGTSRAFNDGAASVSFTPNTATGGPATGYYAVANPGGMTGTGTSSPITVTGLQSSTQYSINVMGVNSTGMGAYKSSNLVTATTVPQAPTIGTVTVTNSTTVSIPFTAGATGGKAITSYTITSSPALSLSYSGTSSPMTVTGSFATNQAYTFTMTATNANGTSVSSAASNSVTPAAVMVSGGTLTSDATYYYRTFTANDTLSITGGTVSFDALVIGGGGGGCSAAQHTAYGGGSGAWGTATKSLTGSISVTIGGGGAVGATGGTTTFSTISCTGGSSNTSGGTATGATASGSANGGVPPLGNTAGGTSNINSLGYVGSIGGGGGGGTGTDAYQYGGAGGGAIPYGKGGNGGNSFISGATAASGYGAGGGGGQWNSSWTDGTPGTGGLVIVRYLRSAVGG